MRRREFTAKFCRVRLRYNLAASSGPRDRRISSAERISSMTLPVFGSIRLTAEAAPCEPNFTGRREHGVGFADAGRGAEEALRELALRRAAERIDADLIERMQAQAIEGPWAAGERILAYRSRPDIAHRGARSQAAC